MSNKILMGTAMLSAVWEKEQKDTIDLLIPFIKFSIAKKTNIHETLDIKQISLYFKEEFGYTNIPQNVIDKMLTRLTKLKTLKKHNKQLTLIENLDDFVSEFEEEKLKFREQTSKVIESLVAFFKENSKIITYNQASDCLISFFGKKGITIFKDVIKLETIHSHSNEIDYFLGQFIIQEYKKDSLVFKYLNEILKGFFISTTISLQSENPTITSSKFKDVIFYFDTRMIFNALGYHLHEAETATLELIEMLKNYGAKICYFDHNLEEIIDVLSAYKDSLIATNNKNKLKTLEGLDEKRYTATDVNRILSTIKNKIENIGITLNQNYCDDIKYERVPDESELNQYLKKERPGIYDKANEKDVKSIFEIYKLRNGVHSNRIEESKAIFVTTNALLVKLANDKLKYLYNENVPALITDINLSAIVWIKNFSTHRDYPKLKLIENAKLALEPSENLLKVFYEKIEKIKKEGKLTEDEASILRIDIYSRKDLVEITYGNVQEITDETIYDMKNRLIDRYIVDKTRFALEEYKKKILSENKRNKEEEIKKIALIIQESGNTAKKQTEKIWECIFIVVMIVLFIYFILGLIYSSQLSIFTILSGLFATLGFIDYLYSKFQYIKKIISKFANKSMHKAKDKKRNELKKLFSDLFNNDEDMI